MTPREHFDVVIVGSGFGGAVAACRLAATGRRVLVLERGRWWTTDTLPGKMSDAVYSSRLPHKLNGWFDLRFLDQMVVVTGAGVGGGSLVYANVCIDADRSFFRTGWPSEITYAELEPYYAKVATMLKPEVIPDNQLNPRVDLLKQAAEADLVSYKYTKVPLAVRFGKEWSPDNPTRPESPPERHGNEQGTCVHCGKCIFGCPVNARNTLDLNYLAEAQANHAEIWPLSVVSHVSKDDDTERWVVNYHDVSGGKRRRASVSGDAVILAAGSIGSTEILLRSRDEFRTLPDLPSALGRGWSPNGDFLTLARYRGRAINPTHGPTIGAAVDYLDGIDEQGDGIVGVDGRIFVEDGGLPNFAEVLLANWRDAGRFKKRIYDRAVKALAFEDRMLWFGQAVDGADGQFSLRSRLRFWRARMQLDWNPQRSERALDVFSDKHIEYTLRTGGKPAPLVSWKWLRMLATPHPLGGCNMGSSPAVGVVDHTGQVWGQRNLYVMDGAVIPRSIGRNPSKTIAAVAERCCELLTES